MVGDATDKARTTPGKGSMQPTILKPAILVVEDDVLVRLSAVESLEELGYVVLEAATAAEAITLLEHRPDIRIVFTDVQMPGTVDGLMLAEVVSKRWPPVKLFITSALPLSRPPPTGAEFLPKPYVFAHIEKLFATALAT